MQRTRTPYFTPDPPPVAEGRWEPVTLRQLALFGTGFALFLLAICFSERGFVPVLDHANLLFHEAGHVFLGLFSRKLEVYGGTLGQWAFPTILAIHFFRRGQPLAFATALVWFFQNTLNIARYVADARTMHLPLVGGGMHDWNSILNRWNLLAADRHIALGLEITAALGLLGTALWVLTLAPRRTKSRSDANPTLDPPPDR